MVGITEYNKMKNELIGLGYSLKYIDEWQPKTILYRHKPSYFAEGGIADEVGTFIENVPGNPDYVMRKAKIGLFTWPPSNTCECRWCVSADPSRSIGGETVEAINDPPPEEEPEPVGKGTRRMGPHFKAS